jgi:hypothetical protein
LIGICDGPDVRQRLRGMFLAAPPLTPKATRLIMLMVFTSVSSRHAHCVKVQDEHLAAPGLVTAW